MCFSASEHKLSEKSSCEFTRKERWKKKKNPQAINKHTIKKKMQISDFSYIQKKEIFIYSSGANNVFNQSFWNSQCRLGARSHRVHH